jgi:branched-chain amino acid transport system substrate-binding protein
VAAVICAVTVSACGGGKSGTTAARRHCRATVGFIGSSQQPLGRQQLAFARLAVASDDAAQHMSVTLEPARTGVSPTLAADRFATQGVMAVVGPAANGQVQAVGPLFARAGLAFISPSATGASLTDGANPTFFRVVPSDSLEGTQVADFVAQLRPRGLVTVIDDGAPASRQFVRALTARFRAARVQFDSVSATEGVTPVATLAAHIGPLVPYAVLAWQSPSEAGQLGRILLAQHKTVTLIGPSQLFDPVRFATPGAYVADSAPDITALPGDAAFVQRAQQAVGSFGIDAPPAYAAAHVIDSAIAAVCRSGRTLSRSAVLAAIRSTDQSSSVLGIPIRFRASGDLTAGRWFMFKVQSGRYRMVVPQ